MPRDSDRPSLYLDNGHQGWVYVLGSRFMTDPESGLSILKIGATRKHPIQRAAELNAATGVAEPMDLLFYHDFRDCFEAERLTHEHLADVRVNNAREFFRVALDEAVRFVSGLCNSSVYREAALMSEGLTGGTYQDEPTVEDEYPYASLFSTFDDDGSARKLTPAERAECQALEERLRYGR